MDQHHYGWEKLYKAVNTMATVDTSLAERLEMAFLELVLLEPEHLPAELWKDMQEIVRDGTRVEAKGGEGKIAATIRSMNEVERGDLAEKIFECFVRLSESRE